MTREIRGWEETTGENEGGTVKGVDGGWLKEKSLEALHRKRMTGEGGEAWERGQFNFHLDILGIWTQC